MRSSIGSPDFIAVQANSRTLCSAQMPPTKPSMLPSLVIERDVACVRARRALGAHDGRGRKRRALRGELFSSPRQRVISHCGGCAFPFIAAHTRAGKHGMSMCLMPLAW